MMNITINTQDNGYTAHAAACMIDAFNRAAEKLFPNCTVEHFYYGERLDMATIHVDGGYAHFNITSKRVSLSGYTCKMDVLKIFELMTYHDELYAGKLLDIAQ